RGVGIRRRLQRRRVRRGEAPIGGCSTSESGGARDSMASFRTINSGLRHYFLSETFDLVQEVLQVVRDGFDDQVLNACGPVPIDLLDDRASIAMKSGLGLRISNGPADPGLHAKRQRKVWS